MSKKMYECPDCGAKSCYETELNTFYCPLCDDYFDAEVMFGDSTYTQEYDTFTDADPGL